MDNWFKSKWFIRAISLGFAILLYVFVAIEETDSTENESSILFGGSVKTETLQNVPVDIRIDSDKYVVSGVPETVNVSLEGPTSALAPVVRQKNIEVYVDLTGLKEGEHEVEIKHEEISSRLSVYIEPKTINIIIEERSTDEFAISVDFINEDKLPEGYQIGDYKLNTDKVTITSSKEVIDRIAIVKVYVDVAGVTESIKNREVPVNVYDSQGNELGVRVDPTTVVVSVDIDNPSKRVPVSVATTGKLPNGYSLVSMEADLKEIEIFATSDTLANIDEITTEPINLSDITKSGTIEVNLALPKKVQAPTVDSVKVQVVLEQTKSLEDVPIEVDNLSSGQVINFVEPNQERINITVSGNEQDVRDLKAEDFRIYINANGLDIGRRRVPLQVEGPNNITVELDMEEVVVEIEEA
ncbi:YbbR-like domain-containing protein [Ornithinibacillus scapharcae]|uniref:CdaR family protein n=1 Tax=Ornithinibacillus scapharcae TaxID=1147159 RepID=UPI000225B42C|nr:CdaR family protein [Ornithinibacillus scapharcae]